MANYSVRNNIVYARVKDLTEEELRAVKNYKALGYELKETKEKIKKPVNEKYTKSAVKKFLEEHGTKEQIKKYDELYNAPVMQDGKPKTLKDGKTVKVKGHIGTLAWFKKTFPEY